METAKVGREETERPTAAPPPPALSTVGPTTIPPMPPGVKILEMEEEKLRRILIKLLTIPQLFDDRSGGIFDIAKLLMRRDVVAVELGDEDGVLYAENVERGGHAYVHIVVFNRRRLKDLDATLNAIMAWAFSVFQLAAISAWIPAWNRAALHLVGRLDFQLCGVVRSAGLYGGKRSDILIYEAPNGRRQQAE